MTTRPASPDKASSYWTGLGVSIGAGIGLVIGLLGWGASGIALGVSLGAGVRVALGAARDSLHRDGDEVGRGPA